MSTAALRNSSLRTAQPIQTAQATQAPAAPKDGLPNPSGMKRSPNLAQGGFTAISGDKAAAVASKTDRQVSRNAKSERAPRPQNKNGLAPGGKSQHPGIASRSQVKSRTLPPQQQMEKDRDAAALANARVKADATGNRRAHYRQKLVKESVVGNNINFVQDHPKAATALTVLSAPVTVAKANQAAKKDIKASQEKQQLQDAYDKKWGG